MKLCYLLAAGLILSSLVMAFLPEPQVFAASEQLIDSYWSDAPNSWNGLWAIHPSLTTARSGHGQCFYSPASYTLSRATFQIWLNYTGTPKPVLRAALYKMNTSRTYGYNGNPEFPFTALVYSPSLNITGESSRKINFTFSGYVMTAGYYCITVEGVDGIDASNHIGLGMSSNGVHAGNRISYDSDWWYAYPTYDCHFYVYGVPYTPSDTQVWIGIAAPHVYAAVTIWSLAMIVGVGAAFMTGDVKDLPYVILIGLGILVVLFVSLTILSAFGSL